MSKNKDHNALVGRVKKAVKKTRRKLSEEQFDKELQRTINFLSELKDHVGQLHAKAKPPQNGKTTTATPAPQKKADVKAKPVKAAAVVTASASATPTKAAKPASQPKAEKKTETKAEKK